VQYNLEGALQPPSLVAGFSNPTLVEPAISLWLLELPDIGLESLYELSLAAEAKVPQAQSKGTL